MARKISRSSGRNTPRKDRPAPPREEELMANLLLGLLLFMLAVLVFLPAFSAGFIWDDDQLLTDNPQVHAPDGWWKLWLQPATADYFPLMSTTLWIEYHLAHLSNLWNIDYLRAYAAHNPQLDIWNGAWSGYHIMNVLFHATAVVLTWQVLKRLRVPGAWVAAAIFAVHPVCVESVAWISERKNSISQIFFLLAIMKYVRFEENGRVRTYVWAVVCFTLSLLAKTSVVMLPFILLLLAWWRRAQLEPLRKSYQLRENRPEYGIVVGTFAATGAIAGGALALLPMLAGLAGLPIWAAMLAFGLAGGGAGYWLGLQATEIVADFGPSNTFAGFEVIRTLPFFLSAATLGAVTVYFQYGRAIGGEQIPIGNMFQRVASACFATGFYLYSAFWPFNIIEIYPQWHRSFSENVTFPTPHTQPPPPEAIPYLWQLVPGLIIGGLLVTCWVYRNRTWARALLVALGSYIIAMLPALGLLYMSYMRLTLVADHFQYISIVAVIALVVAAGNTRSLNPIWLCVAAAFFATASYFNWSKTQDNWFVEVLWIVCPLALAAVLIVAPKIWKYAWGTFLVLVLTCFSVISWGQTEIYHSEKTLWSATLDKNKYSWQAHNHLGAALYMEGNWMGAYPHFLAATQLKPENPESHNNLGLTYSLFAQHGQPERMADAIREFETAVKIKDDSAMETNLANGYEQTHQYDKAIATYKHALDLNADNASATCNLGYALMQQHRVDEAIPYFMKTIELDPGMAPGRQDLIQALQFKGIDLNSPKPGAYPFDLKKALDLLRATEPHQPQQPQP